MCSNTGAHWTVVCTHFCHICNDRNCSANGLAKRNVALHAALMFHCCVQSGAKCVLYAKVWLIVRGPVLSIDSIDRQAHRLCSSPFCSTIGKRMPDSSLQSSMSGLVCRLPLINHKHFIAILTNWCHFINSPCQLLGDSCCSHVLVSPDQVVSHWKLWSSPPLSFF